MHLDNEGLNISNVQNRPKTVLVTLHVFIPQFCVICLWYIALLHFMSDVIHAFIHAFIRHSPPGMPYGFSFSPAVMVSGR